MMAFPTKIIPVFRISLHFKNAGHLLDLYYPHWIPWYVRVLSLWIPISIALATRSLLILLFIRIITSRKNQGLSAYEPGTPHPGTPFLLSF